jgi:hypothetical protein
MQRLVRGQAGVLAARQALDHGWSRDHLRQQIDAQRWTRLSTGVYAAQTGGLSDDQRIFAAILMHGAGAVASHGTALWLADPAGNCPRIIHVTIPARRFTERSHPGVVVHRSRDLHSDAVHPSRHPPRVIVERAVVDCLRIARTDDEALALVARVIQRGLTTGARLRPVLASAAALPRRRLALRAVDLATDGAHSAAEIRYHQEARAHNLPAAECQKRLVSGGAEYLDAYYSRHPGRVVVVELDGRLGHFDASSWRRDMWRDSRRVVEGNVVLRLPALPLFTDPGQIMIPVARVLGREGWRGSPRPCRKPSCSCHQAF